jgi:hypothetical protein
MVLHHTIYHGAGKTFFDIVVDIAVTLASKEGWDKAKKE